MTAFRLGRGATVAAALLALVFLPSDYSDAQGRRGGGSRGGSFGGGRGGSFRGSSGGSRGISGFRGSSGSPRISRGGSSGIGGSVRSFRGSSGGSSGIGSSIRSFQGGSSSGARIRNGSSFPNHSGGSILRNSGGTTFRGQSPRQFSQPGSFSRGSLFPQTGSTVRSGNFGGSSSGRNFNSGSIRSNRGGGINFGGNSNIIGSNRNGLNRGIGNRSGNIILNSRSGRSQFASRWNNWSNGRGGYRSGYRRGLRNSWGLWLAGGYGGWGLGIGNFGYGSGFLGGGIYGGGLPLGYFGYDYYAPVNGYYNPYCETPGFFPATNYYDYSQPIIGSSSPNDTAVDSMTLADEAFRAGDYSAALSHVDKAAREMPNNADVHQFRSLVLFAMRNYRDSAAAAHSALMGGRGWNWETLRGFYPSKDVYTAQLRSLESARTAAPTDPALRFLLGYHYMMLGHADAAASQLVVVTEREPRDQLAAELLTAIEKQTGKTYRKTQVAPPVPPLPDAKGPILAPRPIPASNGADAKLMGTWKSTQPDGTVITLVLKDGNRFQWTADNAGRKTTIDGKFSVKDGQLQFDGSQPNQKLEGTLTVKNDKEFDFRLKYLPEEEPGLTFKKN